MQRLKESQKKYYLKNKEKISIKNKLKTKNKKENPPELIV